MTAVASLSTSTGSRSGGGGRRGPGVVVIGVVAAIVVAVVVLALLAPAQRNDGPPLDPTSTGAKGTKAAVEVAGRLGADVEVSSELPGDDADVAIAFEDIVAPDREAALREWIAAGHTFVMADPASALTPPAQLDDPDPFEDSTTVDPNRCDVVSPAGVSALTDLEAFGPVYRFDVPPDATGCFADRDGAVVVVERIGRGLLVSVGSPWLFTNEALDQADNAGLFAALAVPERGTRLSVLTAGPDGTGLQPDDSGSLGLPTGVTLALLQLLVAFVLFALYRARRLGRPVPEDPPVEIAGSELTRAVGGLMEHAGARDRAAASLRRSARRRLAAAYGLAAGSPPEVVVITTEARSGIDRDRLERALYDHPVADDAALAAVAREVDDVVALALGGHVASPPAPIAPTAPAAPPDPGDRP
jgi:hypothetical protein